MTLYLLIFVSLFQNAALGTPTAEELLDKYIQTQAKLRTSYISKAEGKMEAEISVPSLGYQKGKIYEGFDKVELRSDSKNYFARHKNWGDHPGLGRVREDQVMNTVVLWNGESRFQYGEHPDNPNPTVNITCKEDVDTKKVSRICDVVAGGPIRGSFNGSDVTIDKELRHADTISVRPEKENINGSDCYVIDAKDKRSEFVIWIDPEHDYNIVQAKIKRNSVSFSDPNNYENPGSGTSQLDLKNVVFKDMNGIWLPVECDYNVTKKMDNGEYFSEDHHHKITEFVINPDHKALRSFDPNSFIPNGAQVRLKGINNCTWQDGKIIDSYGHEVDLDNIGPISLVGQSLPSLSGFNVRLDPEIVKNKMLLVCFWDIDQRPSRNTIQTLNKRAQALLDNSDVYMVFIHAGVIEEQKIVSWLKRNEIQPPVGISRDGLPELGYTWGAQSLPWLILTDKNHVVITEGFTLNELSDKIRDAENAKQ